MELLWDRFWLYPEMKLATLANSTLLNIYPNSFQLSSLRRLVYLYRGGTFQKFAFSAFLAAEAWACDIILANGRKGKVHQGASGIGRPPWYTGKKHPLVFLPLNTAVWSYDAWAMTTILELWVKAKWVREVELLNQPNLGQLTSGLPVWEVIQCPRCFLFLEAKSIFVEEVTSSNSEQIPSSNKDCSSHVADIL